MAEGAAAAAAGNGEQHAWDGAASAPEAAAGVDAAFANGSDNPGHSNPGVEGAQAAGYGSNNPGHGQDSAHVGARIRRGRNSCIGDALITPLLCMHMPCWCLIYVHVGSEGLAEFFRVAGRLTYHRHLLRHGRW